MSEYVFGVTCSRCACNLTPETTTTVEVEARRLDRLRYRYSFPLCKTCHALSQGQILELLGAAIGEAGV